MFADAQVLFPDARLSLDSKLPHRKVSVLLKLLLSLLALLGGGESTAHGTRLLGAQVQRHVLLALVEFAQILALLLGDNGENACNRLADFAPIRTRYEISADRSEKCEIRTSWWPSGCWKRPFGHVAGQVHA